MRTGRFGILPFADFRRSFFSFAENYSCGVLRRSLDVQAGFFGARVNVRNSALISAGSPGAGVFQSGATAGCAKSYARSIISVTPAGPNVKINQFKGPRIDGNATGRLRFPKHFAIHVQRNGRVAKRYLPAPPLLNGR